MLLFFCLWNKSRRGSDALSWEKKKSGIVPCMRKICLEDYSGDLHLDLRRKRCTASLPGFGQSGSLPKDLPHLPTRTGRSSHPSPPRTTSQAPIPGDWLMAGTIAWDRGSPPKPKPARAAAVPSVGWGSPLGTSPLTPSFTFPGVILRFTTQHLQ